MRTQNLQENATAPSMRDKDFFESSIYRREYKDFLKLVNCGRRSRTFLGVNGVVGQSRSSEKKFLTAWILDQWL